MPGGSSVYRFGPFDVDPLRGHLFRGRTRVWLADSQVAILLKLVSCPGEVIAKDTLARAAWPGTAVTDNSVDQAVSRLRKILGGGKRASVSSPASRLDDRGGRDFLQRPRAAPHHGQPQFVVENLEHAIHALLAKG